MKNIKIVILTSIAFVLMVFCVSGCSTVQKLPIKLDPNFSNKGVNTIILMPVVDRRPEKSAKINFDKEILAPSKKILEKKGYAVTISDKYSEDSNISSEQVAEMTAEELCYSDSEHAARTHRKTVNALWSKTIESCRCGGRNKDKACATQNRLVNLGVRDFGNCKIQTGNQNDGG